ncbi:MAG: succinate dehydrogenase cytochrome b subunit [Elusimicrobia bacterium]|nr:succinate dehydrogenase cytochrome b subunit [Elusimicrobiota bacterium]MDE2312736.1 succinate dehydrogenase cytochrome b subunit [Elusimicrobiota bacterium]
MRCLVDLLESSIAKKISVALAGILLVGFLAVHLAGNLFLLAGPQAFNGYAEHLANNPLLPAAEILLAALFLWHIAAALVARAQNRKARPHGYQGQRAKGGRTWGSRSMTATALLLLAFLIVHLKSFRFAPDRSDLYALVMKDFQNKYYVGFYVLAMGALALHLSHGIQSAFQTFGVNHPRYTPWIKRASVAAAVLLAAGFAFLPVWALVTGGAR